MSLKLTANDMKEQQLIDGIIDEPVGGAHSKPEEMFSIVKKEIITHLSELLKLTPEERVKQRINKFCTMGVVIES